MPDVRPIDANALKVRCFRSTEFNRDTGSFDLPVVPWHDIEDADTLDYVPVRHGEWLEGLCSACGVEAECTIIEEPVYDYDWEENLRFSHFETKRIHHETNFCPNCGAMMDGGKKDA